MLEYVKVNKWLHVPIVFFPTDWRLEWAPEFSGHDGEGRMPLLLPVVKLRPCSTETVTLLTYLSQLIIEQ